MRWGQIIARTWRMALVALLGALVLTACSATRIAYNQAPTLAYWWIDAYADLTDKQSVQVRQDIDRFLAWHRESELPLYADRLAQWQTRIMKDIPATQACTEFDAMRAAYLRALDRSLEPLTALALQLSPEQLQHMRRHQEKGNQDYVEKYLSRDPTEHLDDRLERYVDRYETLYGELSERQKEQLRAALQDSRFDPKRSLVERVRRQEALLQAVGKAQSGQAGSSKSTRPAPGDAMAILRAWAGELLKSPAPGYADYLDQQVRDGCAQFAAIHNSTSPEQRAHAVQLFKRYEEDLRALAAPN